MQLIDFSLLEISLTSHILLCNMTKLMYKKGLGAYERLLLGLTF